MARLVSSDWESGELTESPWTKVGTNVAIATDQVHGGTYSVKSTAEGSYVQMLNAPFLSALDRDYFLRVYYRFEKLEAPSTRSILVLFAANTSIGFLELQTDGSLKLRDANGTQIGSASATMTAGQWEKLEMRVKVPTEGLGTLAARLNGTEFASSTEADVNNSIAVNTRIRLLSNSAGSGGAVWVDDFALNDGTGEEENSWPTDKEGEEKPLVELQDATGVGETGATLKATLNPRPGSEGWNYWFFMYGTDEAAVEALEEPPAVFGGEGEYKEAEPTEIEVALTELEPSTRYYYIAVVEDSLGQVKSEVKSFVTPPVPTATTGAAEVDGLAVTLNGTANAEGPEAVNAYFEYGETEAYGSQTESEYATEGVEETAVQASPSGLKPNTTYHYRLVVENPTTGLLVYGEDATLETGNGIDSSRVPGAGWKPYGEDSPWNTPVPSPATASGDSAAMVAKIAERLKTAAAFNTERGAEDYNHAVYLGEAEDGKHPVELTAGYEEDGTLGGAEPHAPEYAKPAGGEDGHMAVMDETDGTEYDFWQLTADVGADGTTLKASWGAAMPSDGDGVTAKVGATASGFGVAAGLIRGEDLIAGSIDHALFIIADYVEGFASPATHTGREPEAPEGWPAMGQRLHLKLTDAEIEALGVPEWQEIILKALSKYGAYIGDTGGGLFKTQSPEVYAAAGLENPLLTYAQEHEADDGISTFAGDAYYDMNETMASLLEAGAFEFIASSPLKVFDGGEWKPAIRRVKVGGEWVEA